MNAVKFLPLLRIALGLLLVLTALPPLSIGLCNPFVFILPAAGTILIFLPIFRKFLKFLFGGNYTTAAQVLGFAAGAVVVFFSAEFCAVYSQSFAQVPPEHFVVIVLGAKVQGTVPTIDLQGRIDAAGTFLKKHPAAECIASGGRGADENISEAQCIRDALVSQYGISTGRIILEDESASTLQNIRNSVQIIKSRGLPENAVLVTDGFHLFRTKMIASRYGLKPYACPAATDGRIVVPLYVRELLALPKSFLFDRP